MFFLLRLAFFLGLVLMLLPSGGAQRGAPQSEVGATDAVSAAADAVHDARGFCTREPSACTIGAKLAAAMGRRVQAGARMVYHLATGAAARHQETGPDADREDRAGRTRAAAPSASTLPAREAAPARRARPQ